MARTLQRPAGRLRAAGFAASQALRVGGYLGQYLLSARLTRPPPPAPGQLRPRGPFPGQAAVLRDLAKLLARDWRNVEAGLYQAPEDLVSAPFAALAKAPAYFADLGKVERRRQARDGQEVRRDREGLSGLPRYYLQNFHFQSDGWLSEGSARLYDHQVEVLFTGGADAMRRQALVPLARHFAEVPQRSARLVDLGCGTGRFLAAVKANYPRLEVLGLDLSPPYLAEARRRLTSWRGVTLLAAPAEAPPLAAESVDVVTAIYLFHELPRKVRRQVAGAAARLLKPGGRFVLLDSLQRGEHPPFDPLLEQFPISFHEPYFADYLAEDLPALMAEAGLELESRQRAFFSTCLVFRRAG